MAPASGLLRFRVNPIEVVIFLIVLTVFFHSLYQLFYVKQGFHPTALVPMHANPLSEGRSLASSHLSSLANLTFQCESKTERMTSSSKVRIHGPLCGVGHEAVSSSELISSKIVNQTNLFTATVFTENETGQFSTDYIPLSPGKNLIQIQFSYLGGKKTSHELAVEKN